MSEWRTKCGKRRGTGGAAAHVSSDSPDVLLSHYYFDEVVPITSAKNFEAALRDAGGCVETHYYDLGREKQGHAIWIPGSKPRQHRRYRCHLVGGDHRAPRAP